MDYYHILTKHTDTKHDIINHVCDLSLDSLFDDYLIPYLNGESIIINGYQINQNNTSQFKISKTGEKMSKAIEAVRDSWSSSGIIPLGITDDTIINNRKYSDDVTLEMFKKAKENVSRNQNHEIIKEKQLGTKNVFIVHGHDTNRLEALENFVRKIGFKPIVLFKEADDGKTIIEKIESFSEDVCYCLVLYTKCDIGYSANDENNKKPRARQNVIFEHGYMIGHLGRKYVSAILEDSNIEIPGDINGVVYIPMDTEGAWKFRIAKNMKSVGIEVDLNKAI